MFDDTPSVRRKFLDINISKMDYTYLKSMSEFDKLLKERNELLKQDVEIKRIAIKFKDLEMLIKKIIDDFIKEYNKKTHSKTK